MSGFTLPPRLPTRAPLDPRLAAAEDALRKIVTFEHRRVALGKRPVSSKILRIGKAYFAGWGKA